MTHGQPEPRPGAEHSALERHPLLRGRPSHPTPSTRLPHGGLRPRPAVGGSEATDAAAAAGDAPRASRERPPLLSGLGQRGSAGGRGTPEAPPRRTRPRAFAVKEAPAGEHLSVPDPRPVLPAKNPKTSWPSGTSPLRPQDAWERVWEDGRGRPAPGGSAGNRRPRRDPPGRVPGHGKGPKSRRRRSPGLWRTVPVAGLKLWDISSQLLSVTPSTPSRPRLPVPAPRPTRPSSSKSSTKAWGNHGP